MAQPRQPSEPSISESVIGETVLSKRFVKFCGTSCGIPTEMEIGKGATELREICPISSLVGAGASQYLQSGAGHGLQRDFRKIDDLAIQVIRSHIERFVVDSIDRCFE